MWESLLRGRVLHMVNKRTTGVICGVCSDVIREVNWIQPCLEKGMGDSVAFRERGCLCGWVPVSVDTVSAENMRNLEAVYDLRESFYGRSSE